MEKLSIDFKNFECSTSLELFKDPIQIPCYNWHVLCKICCDSLFEGTVFKYGWNTSKCYCRKEINVRDCVPSNTIARIINNITIICPNLLNGCQWDCDLYLAPVNRQDHITHCRQGYDNGKFTYSIKVV